MSEIIESTSEAPEAAGVIPIKPTFRVQVLLEGKDGSTVADVPIDVDEIRALVIAGRAAEIVAAFDAAKGELLQRRHAFEKQIARSYEPRYGFGELPGWYVPEFIAREAGDHGPRVFWREKVPPHKIDPADKGASWVVKRIYSTVRARPFHLLRDGKYVAAFATAQAAMASGDERAKVEAKVP